MGKLHNSSNSTMTSLPPPGDCHQKALLLVSDAPHMQDKRSTSYLEYSGPNCYTKPKTKTNLQIVRNAICSVCLAGEVNNPIKESIVKVKLLTSYAYDSGKKKKKKKKKKKA